nr:MAG TPA: hypothetical protein [Caudoviricetes sp.]
MERTREAKARSREAWSGPETKRKCNALRHKEGHAA